MPINTLEDLPRAERDAAYARLAKTREELRNRKWAERFNRTGIDFDQFSRPEQPSGDDQRVRTARETVKSMHRNPASIVRIIAAATDEQKRLWMSVEREMTDAGELTVGVSPVGDAVRASQPQTITPQDLQDIRIAIARIQGPGAPTPQQPRANLSTTELMDELEDEVKNLNITADSTRDVDMKAMFQSIDPALLQRLAPIEKRLVDSGELNRAFINEFINPPIDSNSLGDETTAFGIDFDTRNDYEKEFVAALQSVPDGNVNVIFSRYITIMDTDPKVEHDNLLGLQVFPSDPNRIAFAGIDANITKAGPVLLMRLVEKDTIQRTITPGLFYLILFNTPYPQYEQRMIKDDIRTYYQLLANMGLPSLQNNAKKYAEDIGISDTSGYVARIKDWKTKHKGANYKRDAKTRRPDPPSQQAGPSSGITGKGLKPPTRKGAARGITMDPSTGKFGKLIIDPRALQVKFKLKASRDQGVQMKEKLEKEEASDLYDLLTKRFNPRARYSARALDLFEKLRDLAAYPAFGRSAPMSRKADIGKRSYQYYTDRDLLTRLKTLFATINAGNAGQSTLNELSAVADLLLNRKVLSGEEYGSLMTQAQDIVAGTK